MLAYSNSRAGSSGRHWRSISTWTAASMAPSRTRKQVVRGALPGTVDARVELAERLELPVREC